MEISENDILNPLEYNKSLNRHLSNNCILEDGTVSVKDVDILVKYLNNFVCEFKYCRKKIKIYGFRHYPENPYCPVRKAVANDVIKWNFNVRNKPEISWIKNENRLFLDEPDEIGLKNKNILY